MKKILVIALSTFCLMFTAYGHAEITFQGFASFVGGMTLDNDDDSYLGYENKLEYDKNSLYALQASSSMGEGLTVTGQLIARGTENYKPEFEWLYVSYNLTPTLNIKMGRIRTPFYMFSEYLEVGYTYHWIRPPVEVYAAQVTNVDGVSFLYNLPIGNIDSQYMLTIGNRESYSDDPDTRVSDYKPLVASNAQFEFEKYTVKLIYVQGDVTAETTGIDAAAAPLTDTSFVNKYIKFQDSTVVFSGVGFDIDLHPMKVLLEYALVDFQDHMLIADETRLLASFVYSFGISSVHYSWSANSVDTVSGIAAKATGNSTISLDGGTTFLPNSVIAAGFPSVDRDVVTHTIGLRHDFHDSAAFKVELISTENSSIDTDATLVRFGVDMLF